MAPPIQVQQQVDVVTYEQDSEPLESEGELEANNDLGEQIPDEEVAVGAMEVTVWSTEDQETPPVETEDMINQSSMSIDHEGCLDEQQTGHAQRKEGGESVQYEGGGYAPGSEHAQYPSNEGGDNAPGYIQYSSHKGGDSAPGSEHAQYSPHNGGDYAPGSEHAQYSPQQDNEDNSPVCVDDQGLSDHEEWHTPLSAPIQEVLPAEEVVQGEPPASPSAEVGGVEGEEEVLVRGEEEAESPALLHIPA